jgi:hypothetical protein
MGLGVSRGKTRVAHGLHTGRPAIANRWNIPLELRAGKGSIRSAWVAAKPEPLKLFEPIGFHLNSYNFVQFSNPRSPDVMYNR